MSAYKRFREAFWRGPEKIGEVAYPSFMPYKSGLIVGAYWLYYLILRFFTPTGRILFLLTAFIFAYVAFTPDRAPLVYFSFTLIMLFLISVIFGFCFRPKFYLHRTLPIYAEVGTPVVASYNLRNLRNLNVWDVYIDTIECRMVEYPNGHPYLKECKAKEEFNFTSELVFTKEEMLMHLTPLLKVRFHFH